MKRITLILTLVALLVLAGGVLAMDSANYRLAWFTLLTSGGGGQASSTHYAVNFTVGQTVNGTASSTNYEGCLGYWCGNQDEHTIYLPLILRASQ